jgi:rRNA maturation endonuclease Nob1
LRKIKINAKIILLKGNLREKFMARLIRPTWAIRCTQSGCKELFEVVILEDGRQQEVICPACGEHYTYPILASDESK